jgi:hypothetical protein
LSRFSRCKRCPDEDTNRCGTCSPDKQPEEITIEKAIKYFEEENTRYEEMLGDRAILLEDYRINLLVIKTLKTAMQ